MYDDFSADYDRFVDWPGRLDAELGFIERQLSGVGAHRVLDAACGTGMHAIALAQRGYDVVGTDLSVGMIEQARANADSAGVEVRFEVTGFGELAETLIPVLSRTGAHKESVFDAVLCLGNSLPHLLTPREVAGALADFAACLRPGGLALIQNRNFDGVLARGQRWMEPQAHREGESEWIFLRFYDFEADGTVTFNLATLKRWDGTEGAWHQQVASSKLWPLKQTDLVEMLQAAGFGKVICWGDMQGAPFDPVSSPNLVITGARLLSVSM